MFRPKVPQFTFVFGFLVSAVMLAGAPESPTLRLPDSISPTSYQAHLTVDPSRKDFEGHIAIKLDMKTSSDVIWLNAVDLEISKATLTADKGSIPVRIIAGKPGFVGLQTSTPLGAGAATLTMEYKGKVHQQDSSGLFHMEDQGSSYLYTQFESIDARDAFPCFDEPSFKVPWQLTLDVPSGVSAVSNTSPEHEETHGAIKTIQFRQTKPLPSYLVAFAVGPFDFVDGGRAGRNHIPVRIVAPKGHKDEAKYAAAVTATIITRLESYFDIPFPYEKSDQVAIPVTFGFGAMENAGMVTYAQNIILSPAGSDTERRRRGYASVAAHELAHQWFGDLVTTAWWNDIWLNEAFATWMEQKTLVEWKPEWGTVVDNTEDKIYAQGEDSLISARKIRQEIKTNDDISNAFDGITYSKGAAVIAMFENYLGQEEFRKGVQRYLRQYSFRNATAPEFLDAISTGSGKNVTEAFTTFLNQAGVPLVDVALDCQGNAASLKLSQSRFLPLGVQSPGAQSWQIPVCVRYGSDSSSQTACEVMTGTSSEMNLKGKGCPNWVEANDQAKGYYRVNYAAPLLKALSSGDVNTRLSAAERVDFMANSEALSGAGKLPIGDALSLADRFHDDPEWHVVQSALSIAAGPSLNLVPASLRPNLQKFLRQNFGARAHQLGWQPAKDEPDSQKLLRPTLVRSVATVGGDEELAKPALAMTEEFLNGKGKIDPSMLESVLSVGAYYGNEALAGRFVERLKLTNDRQERARILGAMARFRDPAALRSNMQAVLDGRVPMIEGLLLLFAGQNREETRTLAFDFMKEHFDQIAKARPTGGGFDAGSYFPRVGASFCTSKNRDDLESFFKDRVNQFSGAPRALTQVIEGINVCIAQKQAQEPGLVAFLEQYKN